MTFVGQGIQMLKPEQTDRQKHRRIHTKNITTSHDHLMITVTNANDTGSVTDNIHEIDLLWCDQVSDRVHL